MTKIDVSPNDHLDKLITYEGYGYGYAHGSIHGYCSNNNNFNIYTIFALIDHSPVGRIHSEEWA